MGRYPRLKHAPIVEAVVDFRVEGVTEASVPALQDLASGLVEDYPHRETVNKQQAEIRMEVDQVPSVHADQKEIGVRIRSEDGLNVAMLTIDGFTFSRLRPYESWEAFRNEGHRLWELFEAALKPKGISRVALRYINKLELPPGLRDLRDFLTAPPQLPPRLEEEISGYVSRILFPLRRSEAGAAITQHLEVQQGAGPSVVLDIDVFKLSAFDGYGNDAWKVVEQLREEKNRLFFESITDRMRELCQ